VRGSASYRVRAPGAGWRVLDDRERATVWMRRRPITLAPSAAPRGRMGEAAMITAAEIAHDLSGKRAGPGQWLARCPAHKDRTPSLSIREGDIGPLVHCFAGCSQRDVIEALARLGLWDWREPSGRPPTMRPVTRRDDDAERVDRARRIWREAHDPRDTLAERYLTWRGLALDDHLVGRVLRFHPRCPFGKGQNVPALVAAFRPIGEHDDEVPPVAILRVALNPDPSKIAKKMLGLVAGAAIKIDADEHLTGGLGIAEGLETALAVRATGWHPVWTLGSAGAVAKLPTLAGVKALTVFADNDANKTGIIAARKCAKRWQQAGCEVAIRTPRSVGTDWADYR
jgi:hypothetical protein